MGLGSDLEDDVHRRVGTQAFSRVCLCFHKLESRHCSLGCNGSFGLPQWFEWCSRLKELLQTLRGVALSTGKKSVRCHLCG